MGPRFTRGLCLLFILNSRSFDMKFQWGRALRADCVQEGFVMKNLIMRRFNGAALYARIVSG